MNTQILTCIAVCFLMTFSYCRNDNTAHSNKDNPTIPTNNSSNNEDIFLVKTPPGFYKPEGLRPLSIVEQYILGKGRPFTNTFPLKDKFGKSARWDTLLSSPIPIFLQIYVNENNQPIEGVVYEMNDTIKGLIMRVRFAHSGE